MPMPLYRNRVLRPSLSTRMTAASADAKLKICSRPLIKVWVNEALMLIVSRTKVR
jgi:hypothetical protein